MKFIQMSGSAAMFDFFYKSEGGRAVSFKEWVNEIKALTNKDKEEIYNGLRKIGYIFE